MNYLGHAFLSFGDAQILTGNMIGDYVKGMAAIRDYPEGIQKGILLHRAIDSFTDAAQPVQRAGVWFRQEYGLYAGPIVDTLFDHYLATDPLHFKTENNLLDFSQDVYNKLEENKAWFPPGFAAVFPHMRRHNWLYNYRTLMGAQRSLQGLHHRAKHMKQIDKAYETFVISYYEIGQCYYEFMEQAYKFVKDALKGSDA